MIHPPTPASLAENVDEFLKNGFARTINRRRVGGRVHIALTPGVFHPLSSVAPSALDFFFFYLRASAANFGFNHTPDNHIAPIAIMGI